MLTTRIYIADKGSDRLIGISDLNGSNWGAFAGSSTGLAAWPPIISVSTDPVGRIYFLKGKRIHRIDSVAGANYVWIPSANQYGYPHALAVRSNGWIYVAAFKEVKAYDKLGPGATVIWQCATDITSPNDICVDRNGKVFLTGSTSSGGAIREILPNGTVNSFIPPTTLSPFQPRGISLDGQGVIHFANYGDNRVYRMSSITGAGLQFTQFNFNPVACEWANGFIYTSYAQGSNPTWVGAFKWAQPAALKKFGSYGGGLNQFQGPSDIAVRVRDTSGM